jgi:hypothetical protein
LPVCSSIVRSLRWLIKLLAVSAALACLLLMAAARLRTWNHLLYNFFRAATPPFSWTTARRTRTRRSCRRLAAQLPGQGLLRRRRRLRRPRRQRRPHSGGRALSLQIRLYHLDRSHNLSLQIHHLGPRPKTSLFVLSWSLDYQITRLDLQSVFKLYEQSK